MKDTLKTIYSNEIGTPAVGYFWKGFALFLLGVCVGFLFAPIKKGIQIASCNEISNSEDKECCAIEDADYENM